MIEERKNINKRRPFLNGTWIAIAGLAATVNVGDSVDDGQRSRL